MLTTVYLTEKGRSVKTAGCVMLLGGFDGMHVGHRKLLNVAKAHALPIGVMTIVGGKKTENLFTFEEREDIFRRCGVDLVFELPFEEIKDLSPEQFLQLLCDSFSPKAFICGDDFRFGKGASGTPDSIKTCGVLVQVEKLVEMDGKKVSATAVKALLQSGDLPKANALLGEPFFLIGSVEADRQIGRTIGFPTANIRYAEGKFPLKQGVYETETEVDGKVYKGITNYGARPTFDNESVWTETYLDGYSGDLYGKRLQIKFLRFLREIKKFDRVDDLKRQLQEDVRRINGYDQIRAER